MHTARTGIAALLALTAPAATALADLQKDGYAAPDLTSEGGWKNWMWLGVFAALLLAAAIKNPRRTHLN